jgi:hypothetical protein
MGPWLAGLLVLVTGSSAAESAHAEDVGFGPHDITTLFYISKSDNRNRVDYGMRLDAQCGPASKDAVFPYWRDFEGPPSHPHTLGMWAKMAYGVSEQGTGRKTPTGSDHAIILKQVDRQIWITTSLAPDGHCTAVVRTTIAGVKLAELHSIAVRLSGPISVSYVDIKGKNLETGQPLTERINH